MKQVKEQSRQMPPKQRRSRKDKLHELLKEYLPPAAPVAASAAPYVAPTKFQTGFYEELIVCKGPFCQSLHRDLTPRVQAIGYMYKMYGGEMPINDPPVKDALKNIFAKVGLEYSGDSGQGQGQRSLQTQTSIKPS